MTLPLLVSSALARPVPPLDLVETPQAAEVADFCFPSGLRVVLQRHREHPVVSVRTVFSGGAAEDPVGAEGTAHLAEHAWFRSRDEVHDVTGRLDLVGAVWNAFTSADLVSFETLAPVDAIGDLFALEARRLQDPFAGVDEAALAVEREILYGESISGASPVHTAVAPALSAALFPAGWPSSRPATRESVAGVSLEDLRAYAGAHWTPASATMVVAGDFDFQQVAHVLLTTLPRSLLVDPARDDGGQIRADAACPTRLPAARAAPPPPGATEPLRLRAPLAAPTVVYGWTLPGAYRDDAQTIETAALVFESVLAWKVSAIDGESATACTLNPGPAASSLVCAVSVDRAKRTERVGYFVGEALAAIRSDHLAEWYTEFVQEALNDRRRELTVATDDVASFGGRSAALAAHVHYTSSPTLSADTVRSLRAVTVDGVFDVLRTWVTEERMASVVVEPTGEIGAEWTEQASLVAPRLPRAVPAAADEAVLGRRLGAPDLSTTIERTLPNGLRVVVMPVPGPPRVHVGLVLAGGEWTSGQPGLATMMNWLSEWTWDPEVAEAPRRFFGEWRDEVSPYATRLGVYGASGNVEAQLYLVRSLVRQHRLIPQHRRFYMAWLEGLERDAVSDPNDAIARTVAAAWPGVPDDRELSDVLRAVSNADVKRWSQAILQPANATLLVVGAVDPEQAFGYAESWFGDWKPGKQPVPARISPAEAAPERDRRVLLVTDDGWPAAAVTLGCAVPGGTAARLLSDALEAQAWEELREQQGVTYGVWSAVTASADQDVLEIGAIVPPDRVATVVESWFRLIGEAATWDAGVVDRARFDRIRSASASFSSQEAVYDLIVDQLERGLPVDAFVRYPATVAAITPAEVHAQATACGGHEVVVVRGPSGTGPRLTDAGIVWEDAGTMALP